MSEAIQPVTIMVNNGDLAEGECMTIIRYGEGFIEKVSKILNIRSITFIPLLAIEANQDGPFGSKQGKTEYVYDVIIVYRPD